MIYFLLSLITFKLPSTKLRFAQHKKDLSTILATFHEELLFLFFISCIYDMVEL